MTGGEGESRCQLRQVGTTGCVVTNDFTDPSPLH